MANPNQYFLLADHIKLSLLERQRAVALNLEPRSQDGHISRSLESLKEGLEGIEKERIRLQEAGETSYAASIRIS
jgi:syntaxin 8